jgi:hypothetical protein
MVTLRRKREEREMEWLRRIVCWLTVETPAVFEPSARDSDDGLTDWDAGFLDEPEPVTAEADCRD